MKATFSAILLLCFLGAVAQNDFFDPDYFLVESLDQVSLSAEDSALVQSKMSLYHQAKQDTSRLAVLEDLIDECWNDEVWPLYNDVVLRKTTQILSKTQETTLRKKYLYYHGVAYANKGYLHDIQSDFERAELHYQKALEAFKEGGYEEGQGKMLYAIALINEERGRLQAAIDFYNQALRLAETSGDSSGLANVDISLGDVHGSLGNQSEALKHYQRALLIAQRIGDKRLEGFASTTLASVYFSQKDYLHAQRLSLRGVQLLDDARAGADKINGLDVLGKIAASRGHLDSAEVYFTEIVQLAEAANRPQDAVQGLLSLAQNDYERGDFAKAEKNANEAYQISKALELKHKQSNAAGLLAEIYTTTKKYEKANQYLLEFNSLKDTLRNESLKNQALEQAISYEYEKQQALAEADFQKEIAVAKEKEARKNVVIQAGIAILVLISIGLLINYKRLKTIRKQKEELDEAYHELELSKNDKILASNLKALQAQMNPHFIFNALNSIQTLVLQGNVDSSYDYINKFATLIRETLNSSEQEYISLKKEIETLETYLKLEKLRFREDFDFEINYPTEIPDREIPPMLIQPFIENAVKHGLFHKETDRKLQVHMHVEDALICVIEDNGIGRKAAQKINQQRNTKHQSYAISSIKKRLNMMQEKLKITIGLEYEDLEENGIATGTRVTLRIPFADHSSNISAQS